MIINRKTGSVKKLYYISTLPNLDKEIIRPTIPLTMMVKNKFSNWKIKRVSFYPTIDKALSSLAFQDLTGMKFYVYSPLGIRSESLIKPSITDIPEAWITDEYWYLAPIEIRLKGVITVTKKGKGEFKFKYGPRQTEGTLFNWDWKEDLKPWEKSNL